jgi:glycosyltransferase involved in cell wall biosynthesis
MDCSVEFSKFHRMKRLLLISYYWPPLGGPGSLRPVKFARYLPEFAYEPIVLTRKSIPYHSMDKELGDQVKHIRTIRTESIDPARLLHIMGMRHYRPKPWHLPAKQAMNFPDHKILWLPFAFNTARRLEFDYVFVTAPPFSAFLSGYYLARALSKPLILDFRDAWLEFPFLPYKTRMKKAYVSHWEKKLVELASLIIVVDENIQEKLLEKYPSVQDKLFVIPNGYDPDDFTVQNKPKTFTASYLGTIREERNPMTILKAVDELIRKKKIPSQGIKLKFIGHIEETYLREIEKLPFTQTYGHLPYSQAIREFSTSHLGVMITTGSKYFFPSRQNEYLAAGLPIIVCGKSRGIHLLEKAFDQGYPGWIFEYNDIEGIKKQIFEVYSKFKQGNIISGTTPYTQYTRRNLTKKLADLIDKIKK